MNDPVKHPKHYTSHPSGVECITITECLNFNIGNAIKYLWRCGLKDAATDIQDLEKAAWYVNREIERLQWARAMETVQPVKGPESAVMAKRVDPGFNAMIEWQKPARLQEEV